MRIPRPAALRRLLISVFGSLFWRTFMLIALLIAISLGVWFQSFRIFEREPRAQQIAMQVVSVVKLTRAALLYSDPSRRRFLLLDLVQLADVPDRRKTGGSVRHAEFGPERAPRLLLVALPPGDHVQRHLQLFMRLRQH